MRFSRAPACCAPTLLVADTAPFAVRAACPRAGSGFYTKAQSAFGKTISDADCPVCHRTGLSGNAGPALAGEPVECRLKFTKITGAGLFDFFSTEMPCNAPGSLARTRYHNVFA